MRLAWCLWRRVSTFGVETQRELGSLSWMPSWTPRHRTHVTCDVVLEERPERVPARPVVGLQPQITDTELVTLAVIRAVLCGFLVSSG